MKRKRITEVFPFLLPLRQMQRKLFFYLNMFFDRNMCGNLVVEGVYSHLCVSDSLSEGNVLYTKKQIEKFFKAVNILRSKGYKTGKLHIQASYGILNYPGLPCDYARAGIALYGVLSGNDKTFMKADLIPILSVKARIAPV